MEQVIWESGDWQIIIKKNDKYPNGYLYVTDGWSNYYPYKCLDGKIEYDYPEEIPVFVKDAVRSYMRVEYNS